MVMLTKGKRLLYFRYDIIDLYIQKNSYWVRESINFFNDLTKALFLNYLNFILKEKHSQIKIFNQSSHK